MENQMGLLRIRVKKGINLAIRDSRTSDPYVVITMGDMVLSVTMVSVDFKEEGDATSVSGVNFALRLGLNAQNHQKLRTRVVKNNCNPEWDDDLTLCVTDPNLPVNLSVYDKDTLTVDDKMGDAEIYIKPYLECCAKTAHVKNPSQQNDNILCRVQPNKENCLSEESCIVWKNGKIVQDMFLRLRNVECGEVEIQLELIKTLA